MKMKILFLMLALMSPLVANATKAEDEAKAFLSGANAKNIAKNLIFYIRETIVFSNPDDVSKFMWNLTTAAAILAEIDSTKAGAILAEIDSTKAGAILATMDSTKAGAILAEMDSTKAGAILAEMDPTKAGAILATMASTTVATITNQMPPVAVAKILATMSNTTTTTTPSTPSTILYAMGSTNALQVADAFQNIINELVATKGLSDEQKKAITDTMTSAINKLQRDMTPPTGSGSTGDVPATTNIYAQFIANIQSAIVNAQPKLSDEYIKQILTEAGTATGCTISISPSTAYTCR